MGGAESLEELDARLIREIDAALAEGSARAGAWLACHPGCSGCCIGPFEITQLDALRLRRGWRELRRRDPGRARRLRARARAAWLHMRGEFPGDAAAGVLADDEEAQERFFTRFESVPCPALDPETKACDLYEFRPVTCRTFGPPIQCGQERFRVCELCFQGATDEQIRASSVEIDPEGLEAALLDRLSRETGVQGLTVIAAVLAEPQL
jgi:Fe-S-cluster containining protein